MTKIVTPDQLITILIGPPCCGKSTYLKSIDFDFVVSSDAIVEDLCSQVNIQYHQFFDYPNTSKIKMKHRKLFADKVKESKAYKHVIWDLTSLKQVNRKKIMSHYPNRQFNAVQFNFKGLEHNILEINKKRHDSLGKYISEKVMLDMFQRFEPVNTKEGFKSISYIDISKWLTNEEPLKTS
jgi:predicted kinase